MYAVTCRTLYLSKTENDSVITWDRSSETDKKNLSLISGLNCLPDSFVVILKPDQISLRTGYRRLKRKEKKRRFSPAENSVLTLNHLPFHNVKKTDKMLTQQLTIPQFLLVTLVSSIFPTVNQQKYLFAQPVFIAVIY